MKADTRLLKNAKKSVFITFLQISKWLLMSDVYFCVVKGLFWRIHREQPHLKRIVWERKVFGSNSHLWNITLSENTTNYRYKTHSFCLFHFISLFWYLSQSILRIVIAKKSKLKLHVFKQFVSFPSPPNPHTLRGLGDGGGAFEPLLRG